MSKNKEDLDMVTFQPFGEETLMSNEEELKNSAPPEEIAPRRRKAPVTKVSKNNSKSDKVNGIVIGLIIASLFIAYDIFMH